MRADTDINLFEEKFLKLEEMDCWIWIGERHPFGYGVVTGFGDDSQGRKRELAHRVAWRFYRGEILDGQKVLHTCDIPPCVNPDHLFLGTQKDNIHDCIKKGRRRKGDHRGEKNIRSIFSPEQVVAMRLLFMNGIRTCEIHRQFGGCYQSVYAIVKNKTWTHLLNH